MAAAAARRDEARPLAAGFDHELVRAAAAGDLDLVARILDAKASTGQLGSARTKVGRAALIRAAGKGQGRVVADLLRRGAEPDSHDAESLRTPLHEAVAVRKLDVVKILLAAGASVHVEDRRLRRAPLLWACDQGSAEIARELLDAGARTEARDVKAMTALLLAAASGHTRLARTLLLDHGADIDARDARYGRTPIEWALWGGHAATAAALFYHGRARVHDLEACLDRAQTLRSTVLLAIVLVSAHEAGNLATAALAARALPREAGLSDHCRALPRDADSTQALRASLPPVQEWCLNRVRKMVSDDCTDPVAAADSGEQQQTL